MDGFGDPATSMEACAQPTGYVEDPEMVAAEPISVNDGDTGIAIELSAR